MCRNIKRLHNFEPPATEEEIHASALQFVRKVSGMRDPSQANADAFERAVAEITEITRRLLLEELSTNAPPRTREEEKARAKARGEKRVERMRAQLAAEAEGA